ncbi:helix-hairpin-helix domain-containing protein [Shewanella sp. SW32]|uniref:ComEA family DNA-binding protein n=1 Tax=unclassified Shewanella TaxID=196818 RepID=UPI0021D8AAB6|nr:MULTISPECIES: helix-hairpin-helix domain-containing protein [unclassified Shewanella]MCU7962528.1 helix-hairpin-helix domain-containing protein [Shewanella sp. SW32]MCU7970422.1 helix-hairpin-helix domain-containing protein [Shewanella sp. SW29]
MKQQKEALRLLEEALKELESPKGSVLAAVQKISRTSVIIDKQDIHIWCQIQLGEQKYTRALKKFLDTLLAASIDDSKDVADKLEEYREELEKLGLNPDIHYTSEEIVVKSKKSGGGYANIGYIEEMYAALVRTKCGNDGIYYQNNLNQHIHYVRNKAHEIASKLFNELKFSGTIGNCFDILKYEVDDKLLDIDPVLAEQLMLAFKSVSSSREEEWSQALTTCRRLLEGLADHISPVKNEKNNGRVLGQGQYVNRLWAFMDSAIESDSNKALAKTHVDFLGSWLEKINKLANKGVHAELGQLEATKAVFHTYLVIADILEYLDNGADSAAKPDINTATIDELEALLGVSRNIAKEIFKFRVKEGYLDFDSLATINGVGVKTVKKAREEFIIDE